MFPLATEASTDERLMMEILRPFNVGIPCNNC